MRYGVDVWISGLWISIFAVWTVGAFAVKRTVRRQSVMWQALNRVLSIIWMLLLFSAGDRFGPLGLRFVPDTVAVAIAGVALTFVGAVLAIWARLYLGRNWSAAPTVKQGHALVQSGPYGLVRHPIYTGFILAAIGTAIAAGELGNLLGVGGMLLLWSRKIPVEEQFMIDQFGDTYLQYRKRVTALIPFVW